MQLNQMTDLELDQFSIETAEKQRTITLLQLNQLNENERRRLYSRFNCSSLHEYCVKRLKMDDGTAGRYISAARLLIEVPEVKEKVQSGSIAVTTVSDAGVFFRREAKLGKKFDQAEKREVLLSLDSTSTRKAQAILISKSSQPEIHFKEKVTPKTETISEVRLHLDEETLQALDRLKEIWSHSEPNASYADLIKRAVSEAVEKHDPVKKAERSEAKAQKAAAKDLAETKSTPAPEPQKKSEVKRQVWLRDKGECTFVDPRTGEICGSRHFVEEDHILPKAMGGEYTLENVRLVCRAHNQRHAINCYGEEKMQSHLRRG